MHLDVISAVREAAEPKAESVAAFVDRALRNELRRTRQGRMTDVDRDQANEETQW
jgi:hypothetical protein